METLVDSQMLWTLADWLVLAFVKKTVDSPIVRGAQDNGPTTAPKDDPYGCRVYTLDPSVQFFTNASTGA